MRRRYALDHRREFVQRRAGGVEALGDAFGGGPALAAFRRHPLRLVERGRIKARRFGKAGCRQAVALCQLVDILQIQRDISVYGVSGSEVIFDKIKSTQQSIQARLIEATIGYPVAPVFHRSKACSS